MKKFLLSLATFAAIAWSASAATYQYGYATDALEGVGTSVAGTNYAAAIKVPAEVAAQMVGSKVTTVSVGFHSGVAKAINVFITKDLSAEPVVKQSGSVKARQYVDIALSTPYEIDGSEFYIGYTYRQSTATGTPIAFDGNTAGANNCFDLLAFYSDGGTPEYKHFGAEYGALAIRATIDGDAYPKQAALISAVTLPSRSFPGDNFDYSLTVRNMGADAISSSKIATQVGSAAQTVSSQNFTKTIAPGETAELKFTTSSTEDTSELPVMASISEVNGGANVWAAYTTVNHMLNSATIATRMPVIEEYTGTGCGYCPLGWVALEAMRERHPDDCIIIGVHLYNASDPMYVAPYSPWASTYVTGAPQATINRSKAFGTFQPSTANCEAVYNQMSQELTPVSMRMWAWYADATKNSLNTRVKVSAAEDLDKLNYGLAWVITRDGMGPYDQSNYYAGGSLGSMGGFENLPSKTPLIFNDVARNILYWNGLSGSVPSSIKRDKPHYYDLTIPVADPASVHGDLNIITLLVNKNNGEIVTATKCKIGDEPDATGITDATESAAPADIFAVEGGVAVVGNVEFAHVYTIDGSLVASMSEAGIVNLPAGLYIVKANANGKSNSAKVIVK